MLNYCLKNRDEISWYLNNKDEMDFRNKLTDVKAMDQDPLMIWTLLIFYRSCATCILMLVDGYDLIIFSF